MAILDSYLAGRERLLNWILDSNPAITLNSQESSSQGTSGGNTLAVEIKNTLNQIKFLAFSEDGKVDYKIITRNPLYQYYRELAGELHHFDYKELESGEEKLAFWINLYNALVIDAVIQDNIQKSVTESRLGVLAFFQRAAYQVNNLRFSLTDIEHGLLRANSGFPYFPGPHFAVDDPRISAVIEPFDPRIHFALNCASNSCPTISVYTPENILDQLDLAAGNFINNDLVINPELKMISISKIFRWYLADFGGKSGILSFIMKYINDPDSKRWLINNRQSIRTHYHPYDWGLNKINS